MVISGTVESIVFRNEENGYSVLRFLTEGRIVSVVGVFPPVQEGEAFSLVGTVSQNPRYGEQFDATEVRFEAPTDAEGMVAYLASGLFRGVGLVTAKAIVKHFGLETLEIMQHAPHRLAEVKGVGTKTAEEMGEQFKERAEMQQVMLFLQRHNIPIGQALRIYQAYGEKAPEVIEKNPYQLIDDVDGIGFLTADVIAEKFGIAKDSDFRAFAAIEYTLKSAANQRGHTYLPVQEMLYEVERILGYHNPEQLADCLRVMEMNARIKTYPLGENGEETAYALHPYYVAENAIAAKLVRLVEEVEELDVAAQSEIDAYEQFHQILLDKTQREAIETAVKSGVMVITGGPGTGKTTIIQCVLELFENRKLKTMLACPTGRAAKRLTEGAGVEAKTLHRLLGAQFEKGKMVFSYNELNQLPTDVVIVDEISMADIFIFHALLKALPKGARLILVGDKDQLPSVSAGNILADIIASETMPVICLTEIYRQEADSLIVVNAHRINNGEMPLVRSGAKDFFVDDKPNQSDLVQTVVEMVSTRIPKYFGVAVEDIQVLCPKKNGEAGVINLNKMLQQALNHNHGKTVQFGPTTYKVGDKVMHTVNNYHLEWKRFSGAMDEGEGVFNGDIGYVQEIVGGEMLVEFEDGRCALYSHKLLEELQLAYAVTVHKSQGSEFPIVVLALPPSPPTLATRNLLYTAVTRAKKAVVIVGSRGEIGRMVNNHITQKRYTLLKELLWKNRNSFWSLKKR